MEQFRVKAVVDIEEAFADPVAADVLDLWLEARRYPDSQPFGGGVLTDWPALAVDGFAACRDEENAIDSFLLWQQREEPSRGP